jgi:hypothetical protein
MQKNNNIFPHSPTTCPSKRTKRIPNKTLLVFFWYLFQNHLFLKKMGAAHGMYLPAAVKGLSIWNTNGSFCIMLETNIGTILKWINHKLTLQIWSKYAVKSVDFCSTKDRVPRSTRIRSKHEIYSEPISVT